MSAGNKMRIFIAASACVTLALAFIVSYIRTDHEKEIMNGFFLECSVNGEKIKLKCWEDETEGRYYLFLPSCFESREKEFTLHYSDRKARIKIDDRDYKDGDVFTENGVEEVHRIQLEGIFGISCMDKTLQVLTSEKLPVIMFEVESEEELFSQAEFSNKKYMETGSMIMLDEAGNVVCREKLEKLKVRGNLTAALDKKPLTFSFNRQIGLCKMAPAIKWNLLANATDGSYIRNKIVMDLANESIDSFEPDGEFTEVYVNGVYQGMYLLTEAVEAAENRLDISLEDGWLLEMELDFRMEEGEVYVISDKGQIFEVESFERISGVEREKLQFFLNDIESALFAGDGVSKLSGKHLSQLIDFDSWAEDWLIQEISGDHDTGIASQFSYTLSKDEPFLYAGPVWDFDGTMGNVNTPMYTNPAALTTSISQTRPEGNANQNRWLSAMYRNPEFQEAVAEKYSRVFRENLEDILNTGIDRYAEEIKRSAQLDALRWHKQRLLWMFVLPGDLQVADEGDYKRFDTLDCHVDFVKEFLSRKLEFLNRLFIEKREYCVVEVRNDAPFLNQDYNQTIYYWVEKGTAIEGLPQYETEEYKFKGYFEIDSGQSIADGSIIWEDCVLKGIWEDSVPEGIQEQTGEE